SLFSDRLQGVYTCENLKSAQIILSWFSINLTESSWYKFKVSSEMRLIVKLCYFDVTLNDRKW
ncbi:MAG TPA: hypothetical protein DD827_07700, partial [Gammaproteobacteria bacterium]|nr:hypothetical protein [Gammaproteobacteria bacterium]